MNLQKVLLDERLDGETLMEMYEGDYAHAGIVFGQFIKNAPAQMEGIDAGFKRDSVEDFRARMHKLKPVFCFVGLTGLSNQAAQLEAQCKNIATLKVLEADYGTFKNDFYSNLPLIQEIFEKLNHEV
jgi:HPt (histidine-containing phosphotransfer) domain-containing protein